jgi:hypothetical protein
MAPTIGTFLRTFTFGFVCQLDAVASRLLAGAWQLGAGPGDAPLVWIDLDSTICEVHGHACGCRPSCHQQADVGRNHAVRGRGRQMR